jgi:hypothetical protein
MRWDDWPWSDFASGRIEKRSGFIFADPDRPWWRRLLILDFVEQAEAQDLMRLINTHYCLPPPPVVPEVLRIRYAWRRKAEFDRAEIRLIIRGKTHHFGWKAVQGVRIVRADPLRRDFISLELMLPEHTVFLSLTAHQGLVSLTWTRAMTERLSDLVMSCLPADRIVEEIAGETPMRPQDVQKQLDLLKGNYRDFHVVGWINAVGLVAFCLFFVVGSERGATIGYFFISFCFVICGLIVWVTRREFRSSIARLEAQLAELQNDSERNHGG